MIITGANLQKCVENRMSVGWLMTPLVKRPTNCNQTASGSNIIEYEYHQAKFPKNLVISKGGKRNNRRRQVKISSHL
ncbi:MAG: hypothetical protein ACI8ZN_002311 [Bacteroidia bacterium]|jgi:hypothetical protein